MAELLSIGNIIAVGQLAIGVFTSCVKAGPDFQAISQDVDKLRFVIHKLADPDNPTSLVNRADMTQQAELKKWIDGCSADLRELEVLLKPYVSLGTSDKRMIDRVKFTESKKADIRQKLGSHVQSLTLFIAHLNSDALSQILAMLPLILDGVKKGQVAPDLLSNLDNIDALGQKLVTMDDSITVFDVEANKDQIKNWLTGVDTISIANGPRYTNLNLDDKPYETEIVNLSRVDRSKMADPAMVIYSDESSDDSILRRQRRKETHKTRSRSGTRQEIRDYHVADPSDYKISEKEVEAKRSSGRISYLLGASHPESELAQGRKKVSSLERVDRSRSLSTSRHIEIIEERVVEEGIAADTTTGPVPSPKAVQNEYNGKGTEDDPYIEPLQVTLLDVLTGKSKEIEVELSKFDAERWKDKRVQLHVSIPCGVENGEIFPGTYITSHAGSSDSVPKISFEVQVESHPVYRRKGANLYMKTTSIRRAMGFRSVIGLDGAELLLPIFGSTPRGRSAWKCAGQGLPKRRNPARRGDLFVVENWK